MHPEELVAFAMIYTSEEMQEAINVTEHHLAQLEEALVKTLDGPVSPTEFAFITSIASVPDAPYTFDKYLTKGAEQISSWLEAQLEDAYIIMPDDLVSIATAYYSRKDDLNVPARLYDLLEVNVLE